MATYQFGVVTTESGTYGLLQSFNATYTQDLSEAKDANGAVSYINGYNNIIDATAEVIYDTTKTLPTVGDTITLAAGKTTGKFRLVSFNIVESNTDFCRLNLTLKRYVTNGLPA